MLTAISGTFTLEGFEGFNLFLKKKTPFSSTFLLAMSRYLQLDRLVLPIENTAYYE
jgi:hypothetical protein